MTYLVTDDLALACTPPVTENLISTPRSVSSSSKVSTKGSKSVLADPRG